jgi:hypothetical protein
MDGPGVLDPLIADGVARNGDRGPLQEVLGELHGGASQSRRNRLSVGFELEAHGAQETVHIGRQVFSRHAGLAACAKQLYGRPAHEGVPSRGDAQWIM